MILGTIVPTIPIIMVGEATMALTTIIARTTAVAAMSPIVAVSHQLVPAIMLGSVALLLPLAGRGVALAMPAVRQAVAQVL